MKKIYTLLQWNIWYKESYKNIINFLNNTGADIVTLQEVTQNHPIHNYKDLAKLLEYNTDYNVYYIPAHFWYLENGSKRFQGNAILTKFPIIEKRHKFLQDIDESNLHDYAKEGRVYLETNIDLGDTNITVGTTHLSYNHKFAESKEKLIEENKLLNEVKKHNSKYILSGDFNVTENSTLIKNLENLLQNAGPDYSHKTWTTKPFSYLGFETDKLNYRLDYVFATPDINVISAKILNTEYSDHLPVLIEFRI